MFFFLFVLLCFFFFHYLQQTGILVFFFLFLSFQSKCLVRSMVFKRRAHATSFLVFFLFFARTRRESAPVEQFFILTRVKLKTQVFRESVRTESTHRYTSFAFSFFFFFFFSFFFVITSVHFFTHVLLQSDARWLHDTENNKHVPPSFPHFLPFCLLLSPLK